MSHDSTETRLTIDEINTNRDGIEIATLVDADGATVTVPLARLPEGAKVNQVVIASFRLDPDSTAEQARRVRRLQHRLFNRDGPS